MIPPPPAPAPAKAPEPAPPPRADQPAATDHPANQAANAAAAGAPPGGSEPDKAGGPDKAAAGPAGGDQKAAGAAGKPGTTGAGGPKGAGGGAGGAEELVETRGAGGATIRIRRRAGKGADDEETQEVRAAPDEEPPEVETGSHTLPFEGLTLPTPSAPFDAPRTLGVRPDASPTANDAKNPDVARYAAVFADAAAAAARFHAMLIDDAARAADAAIAGAARRAEAAQSTLDQGVDTLAEGLMRARSELSDRADAALRTLMARGEATRQAIRRAAGGAYGALAAATVKITADLKKPEKDAGDIQTKARGKVTTLSDQGKLAGDAMTNLAAHPETGFSDTSDVMLNAGNEAAIHNLEPRATPRATKINTELTAQKTFLEGPITELGKAVTKALADFNTMLAATSKQGPAAITRARRAADKQVDKTVASIARAIAKGRAVTDASLIRQHNSARARLIESAESRARGERQAAQARGGRDVQAALLAARGQGGAVKAVEKTFEGERGRPAGEFATVVIRAATGLTTRLAATVADQHPKLARAAAEGRDGLDRQSAATGSRMLASADSGVEVLTKGANDSGTALGKQVDDGTESFSKLPAPIGQAMQGYLKPFQTGYAAKLDAMTKAIDAAGVSFGQVFETGHGGGDGKTATGGEGKTATGGEGKTGAKGPEMAPQKFLDLANKIAPHPEADDDIAAFAVLAHKLVNTNVTNRANELYGALQAFSTSVDTVMRNLRGLTKKRGDALRWWYESHEGHGNLEASLRRELFKTFSADSTNYLNIDAAIAHLNGDEAKAAMLELKAAVNYSNENKRVEEVMRSLSPADLKKLRELPDAQKDLDAIAEDLGGTEETVFNLLRNVDEQHPDNIAQANAIRLKESVDTARKEMGDKGGDQTFDAIKAAAVNAGNDPISGADPLGLDTDETRKARNADTWKRTLQAFDKMEPVPKGEAPPVEGPGAGLYSYATRTRNYYVTTGYGEGAETEIVPQGLSKYQALSIQKLLTSKEGPDSDEVAAARLAVEMNREGGKPDRDKLDAVMHDKSLDQREGEVLTEAQEAERQAKAEARFKRIFSLYEDYTIPKDPTTGKDLEPRRTPEAVQADVVDKVGKAYGNDKEGKLAQSSVKSPGGDPVAVLEYAMDDPKANVDLLKKQMGRMNADQIDAAVKTYEKNHPGEQSVNAKLGIFNEGDHSVEGFFRGAGPALSGDKRNDVEIAFMGVPRTDLERAQVARMIAKQQIDQSGWAGRHLASHEYGNLVRSANDLRDQMGLTQEQYDKSFDAKGRMVYTDPLTGKPGKPVPIGNFSADGKFTPTTKGAAEAFDLACGMTRLEATTYKDATDRIATYITTALVIAAAAITTALTFGAAASIWIPVLVTAGAGLLGMGASRLIKGERYGRDEMIHDLAMTVIQAATAGIGAAAGAAMRGGLPALRAVGGAFKVSEKALETAVEAGGGTLAKSLTIGQDLAIAGGTGAFAGGTSALLDEEARKKYGTFGAVFHGATRGGVGSLAGAGFGKLGGGAIGRLTGRSESFLATGAVRLASSGASGYGQSLTESTYSALVEGRPMTAAEAFEAAKWMALQNVAQSTGEHGLEGGVKARQARAAGVEPHVAVPEHVAPSEVPTAPREAPAAPRETLPPSAGHPPEEIAPHPELATRPPPVAAPIEAPRPPPLPRAANDNEPVTRRGPAPVEEEPATPRLPAPTEEEPVTQRRPAPAEDEAVTQRVPRPGAEEEAPAARPHPAQQPEPEWLAQQKHLPPGSVVIDPEPTNPRRALDDYKERIRESPNREVAIYRNAETGQFIVVQGNENSAFVAILKSGKHEAPMPGGRKQGWKAVLLGHDVGNWQLVAHFHPVEGGGNTAGMPRRLPSGKGGDLSAMAYESRAAGGAARQSRVNYLDNGELRHTDFGFDPHLDGGPYWVEFEHPVTGVREKHPFPTTKAYHDFFEDVTGRPMREIGTATPAASEPAKPAAAPREDDYVFYHGTTAKGQAAIEEKGVTAQRNTGVGDDYSAAFYVTPQEAVGGEYARQRSASAARAGEPSEGRVLAFRVSREDMGAVVDIRPGGEHRAAFEAFMNGPSPFADPRLPGLGHLPQTVGEYVVTFGHDRRGEYFEKFLASIGMSHADAIHGDLGGIGTAGIGGGHPGAEQIAIRSQRLADLLTAQLPGRAPIVPDLPEVPRAAGPGPVGPREAPTRGEPGSVGTTGPVHEPGVAARAQAAADRLTEELAGGRRAAGSGSGGGMPPEREAPTPRPNVADLDESFERTFSHEPPNEPEPPTPPAPVGAERPTGPLFVDIQGGAAVRADTGEPTFLPSLVAQTPGARGVLLEPADFIPGYAGITTTNERDLALARILAQNMPQWPEGPAIGPTPVATNEGDRALLRILAEHLPPWPEPSGIGAQPRPWEWDPSLAFPTQGPVQVLTRPGPPGTTPEPQAFFPPIGHDVVPGIPRLIPIAIGEEQAQRDVARLRPGSHPELHGEVDRAYWRRPFAMSSATPEVTAAMGQEIARWLKPGGFIEFRLLRPGDRHQALGIADQIPGHRVIEIGAAAIKSYIKTGERPGQLRGAEFDEHWAMLQDAGPDIREDFGALGQGKFNRIIRVYRGESSGPAAEPGRASGRVEETPGPREEARGSDVKPDAVPPEERVRHDTGGLGKPMNVLSADPRTARDATAPGIDQIGVVPASAGGAPHARVQVVLADDRGTAPVPERPNHEKAPEANLSQTLRDIVAAHSAGIADATAKGAPVDPDHAAAVEQLARMSDAIEDLEARMMGGNRATGDNQRMPLHLRDDYAHAVARIMEGNGISLLIASQLARVVELAEWLRNYYIFTTRRVREPAAEP